MPDPNILVHVHHTLDISRDLAETLVGRPWLDDDESFLTDLEPEVRKRLPDLMSQATGEPVVEAT